MAKLKEFKPESNRLRSSVRGGSAIFCSSAALSNCEITVDLTDIGFGSLKLILELVRP